jgi:hypothetical protein
MESDRWRFGQTGCMPRSGQLPSDVRSALRLDRRERVLAWANGPSGEWYVGTDRALHVVTGAGYRRLPWEQIDNASWHADEMTLLVSEVSAEHLPPHSFPVAEGGRLLELLRERVTRSVLLRQFEPVRGKSGVSVIARRSPVGEGPVTWSTVYSLGLEPADQAVVAAVRRARARGEEELDGRGNLDSPSS